MSDKPVVDLPPNPSPEDIAKAKAALAEAWSSEAVQSAVKIDINEFTQKTKDITANFDEVEYKLGQVDALNLDKRKLQPTWTEYKKRWRQLLWDSRDLATEIATSAEQYYTGILPLAAAVTQKMDKKVIIEELQEVIDSIDEYINASASNAEKAKDMSDKFKELGTDCTNFGKTFESWGQDQEAANKAAIKKLEDEITDLINQIASKDAEIQKATDLLQEAVKAVNVLKWIPFAWLLGLSTALIVMKVRQDQLDALKNQRADLVNRMNQKRKEKAAKEAENALIVKTRLELVTLANTKVQDIATGLGSFETIWAAVNADCMKINKYMTDAKKSGSKPITTPTLLTSYFKNTTSVYVGLADAMTKYAIGITNSGIPPAS